MQLFPEFFLGGEADPAASIAAMLADQTVFAWMFFGAFLLRYVYQAVNSINFNERHT
jgi:hypothetical protein